MKVFVQPTAPDVTDAKPGDIWFLVGSRVYLAGPMRGYPDFNFPAFHVGSAALRARGFSVFSPAERDITAHGDVFKAEHGELDEIKDSGFSLREALAADTQFISLQADAVVVLPGWEKSSGANAEVALAKALSLPVLTLEEALAS